MQRKVLYVITKANWGGAQRYVFDLATNLPKDEFTASVAFGQPGLLADKLKDAGIETHRIDSMQRDVSLRSDWATVRELAALCKKERPDIVHLNSSKAGGVGALAARIAGVPRIIFTAHGWPFQEKRSAPGRAFIWFFSWMTALLCDTVICVSEHDLQEAGRMPFIAAKAVRIYNGIAPMQLGSGDIIRSAFPAGARITGTIGELNKNKNQQALIEQAKNTPHMRAAIVGEGEDRPKLEALIKKYDLGDRVKLFGFMPAADVLRGFDVFALPSLKEGLPYVLLEAKAAGLPIEAARVGGIPEILDSKNPADFTLVQMLAQTIALYK